MVEAKVDERATTTVGILDEAVSPTALEREVEPRIARLEELVAALGVVLERFQSARPAFGATVFDNFDDAGASADALGILSEATADARLDLHVLQRDVPSLVAPSEAGLQRPFASQFGLLREICQRPRWPVRGAPAHARADGAFAVAERRGALE